MIVEVLGHEVDSRAALAVVLNWSAWVTFAALSGWLLLRLVEKILDWATPRGGKQFPVSAQRKGFAQGLGVWSVIVSESDYERRARRLGWFRKLAREWWPIGAFLAFAQFMLLYGAKGLTEQTDMPYWMSLPAMGAVLGGLGLFRKKMLLDHLRGSSVPEGKKLDWDAEGYVGGIRLRARFEGQPRRALLSRQDDKALSKDGSEPFAWHGVLTQPDSVHWHGSGLLVSEFRMLDGPGETLTEENWLRKVKERDVLQSVLSAYVLSRTQKAPACALLEYPGAVIQVYPLAEHVDFVEQVADRIRKRRSAPSISAREVCLAAGQEFYSRFTEKRVAELLAQNDWVSKEEMPV